MMNCWQSEPEARPSFKDLTRQLKRMENQHKVRLNSKLFGKECFVASCVEVLSPYRKPPHPLLFIMQGNHSCL